MHGHYSIRSPLLPYLFSCQLFDAYMFPFLQVVALLLGIWVLALAVIYEHIVDFQPTTLSPYRITS